MFRMGMPKRNGSFLLFSVFAALDEFEHFFPLNAPAVPDAKRRDLAFMQKPQHCAAAHLQNLLTLTQRQHIGIFIALFRTEEANLLLGPILAAQHMDCRRHRRDNLNAEQQRVLDYLHRVTSSPQYAYSSSPVIS